MKKLLQLFMILALVLVPSMCFAQREFPDGTVLNDKEEFIYNKIEQEAKQYYYPSSIRFKHVHSFDLEKYRKDGGVLSIGITCKNRSGGKNITTITWVKTDRYGEDIASECEGIEDEYFQDKDVDITKLNHLWKTYHAADDDE